MPRKQGVGMPKRRKKKVVRVEAGASVDTIEGEVAVAEEEPPASPIPTHNSSSTTARAVPPPSPGAVKERVLKAAIRGAQIEVRGCERALKRQMRSYALASKLWFARQRALERKPKRRDPLDRVKELYHDMQALSDEEMQVHCMEAFVAEEKVKLRDCQIALLRFQLRRKSRRCRVGRVLGIV